MGVLFLLAEPHLLGWNVSLSKCIAAEIAIVNNFVWNDLWTFRDLGARGNNVYSRGQRFLRFNLICLIGMAVSVGMLNLQTKVLHLNLYFANLVAILVASLWNFWMNLKFGWRGLIGLDRSCLRRG
jgi:dolichol-phosphate mannosyltransferase